MAGERINAQGSRRIKRLLLEDAYDDIVLVAREQIEAGAHVLDICTALTSAPTRRSDGNDREEAAQSVEVPVMIDSTEPRSSRRHCARTRPRDRQLDQFGERPQTDRRRDALVREAGAAVVALTIDETGMAKTADRKVEVAKRICEIVTTEFGLPARRVDL